MKKWLAMVLVLLPGVVSAAEGMYPLATVEDLPLRQLKEAGLEVRGREVVELSRAVVQVAGGGTGSFVSPDGLVVTNHHVAYGCLAALDAMDEHKGILDNGYLARTRKEELSCPGYYLLLLESTRDITADVRAASKGLEDFHARFEAERLAKEKLVKACEADGKHVCEAQGLDGGRVEQLAVYLRLRDVRLVYAPEKSIGKYGGDIDNWMYPRHTGDYAFLRAWVAPDGSAAGHDEANKPYQPESFLRVSARGVAGDDFVMVMGYPGRTRRFTTGAAARFYVQHAIPAALRTYGPLIRILEGLSEAYADVGRRYAGLVAGLNNATKYYGELAEGIRKTGMLERKERYEAELRKRFAGKKDEEAFQRVLGEIDRIYAAYETYYPRQYLLSRLAHVGSSTVATAYMIHKWGVEKQKPNEERKEQAFKDKNVYRLPERSDRLELQADFRAEAAILTWFLRQAATLPEGQKSTAVQELLEDTAAYLKSLEAARSKALPTVAAVVRERHGIVLPSEPEAQAALLLLARTQLVSWSREPEAVERAKALRRKWLALPGAEVVALDDPLLRFAAKLEEEIRALEEGPYREVEEYLATELHREWVGIIEAPYPDANFTLRLSYGHVRDYTATATGKTHPYLTTLSGVLAKGTGEWPFVVPEKLAAAAGDDHGRWHDDSINDVPVNFTSTLDTTGGNSGSPVMDAEGRLVGLLFDGTSESILSDWQYLEADQRSICVDIRYALFLAEKVHGATELLQELDIVE